MHGAEAGLSIGLPQVGPRQLLGMEIDPLARELAQVAIWIGYLQWMIRNGFGWKEPVLETLETIRLQDALLTVIPAEDRDTEPTPRTGDPPWSPADASGGGPGASQAKVTGPTWSAPTRDGRAWSKPNGPPPNSSSATRRSWAETRFEQDLGDTYVEALFRTYDGRVPAFADLCCYFFEKARAQIERGPDAACWTPGDQLDSRRSESRGAQTYQAIWRHLHGLVRRALDSRRCGGSDFNRRI